MVARTRRKFTNEEKAQAVAAVDKALAEGKTAAEAVKELGLTYNHYRRWKNKAKKQQKKAKRIYRKAKPHLVHLVDESMTVAQANKPLDKDTIMVIVKKLMELL